MFVGFYPIDSGSKSAKFQARLPNLLQGCERHERPPGRQIDLRIGRREIPADRVRPRVEAVFGCVPSSAEGRSLKSHEEGDLHSDLVRCRSDGGGRVCRSGAEATGTGQFDLYPGGRSVQLRHWLPFLFEMDRGKNSGAE